MKSRRLLSVACIVGLCLLAPLATSAQEEALQTNVTVYRAFVDQQLTSVSVNASASIPDTVSFGSAATVRFSYADDALVGATAGGYFEVIDEEGTFGAFAGDVFYPGDGQPAAGPLEIQFQGGSLNGTSVYHVLDFRHQPRRPDLHPSSAQKILKFHADKSLKLQINGFTPAAGVVDAGWYFILRKQREDGGYDVIYTSTLIPVKVNSVDLPAHTLGVGNYRLQLVHYQRIPATASSGAVSYFTTHELQVDRAR